MTPGVPQALRRIVRHVDEMSRTNDPATAARLGVMRRRAEARLAAAVSELSSAAQARDAPAELRALAASVRAGNATWEQCLLGKADDLAEVRAWYAAADRPARQDVEDNYEDEDDDDNQLDVFPFRRDR